MRRNGGRRRAFVSALVKVIVRSTAMHISTIMSNINPHLREADSDFTAVEEPPPALLLLHVKTSNDSRKKFTAELWINYRDTPSLQEIVL